MASKELEELVEFLSSTRPEVLSQAVEIVKGLTGTEDGVKQLLPLDVYSPLLQLISHPDKDVSCSAATCLVNMSADVDAAEKLLDCGAVDRAMEAIAKGADACACRSLLVQMLQNLTLKDRGVEVLMQSADEKLRGLHLSRLIRLFVQGKNESPDTFEDVAMVLVNVTRLPSARAYIMDPNRPLLKQLLQQMQSPSAVRRRGIAGTIRNCCFDAESSLSSLLLLGEFLWPALLLPLAGSKAFEEKDLRDVPDELSVPLAHEREAEVDADVRTKAAEALYLIALQPAGRSALWGVNGPRILQVGYETEEDPEVCKAFETLGSMLVESGMAGGMAETEEEDTS